MPTIVLGGGDFLIPQSCGKIATEVDAAFRTPKNPYDDLMRKILSQMPMIQEILSIVYMFSMQTTEKYFKEKDKKIILRPLVNI